MHEMVVWRESGFEPKSDVTKLNGSWPRSRVETNKERLLSEYLKQDGGADRIPKVSSFSGLCFGSNRKSHPCHVNH